jgi:hypothetical protein
MDIATTHDTYELLQEFEEQPEITEVVKNGDFVMVTGKWRFTGNWGDYARPLDGPPEEGDDDLDRLGRAHVEVGFKLALDEFYKKWGVQMAYAYIDETGFEFAYYNSKSNKYPGYICWEYRSLEGQVL